MNTQYKNAKSNEARDIYWNAVKILKSEYKDRLNDIWEKEEKEEIDYDTRMELINEVYAEVKEKLNLHKENVYNLTGEIVPINEILWLANVYVSDDIQNGESNSANDLYWSIIEFIDKEYKNTLYLLEEHMMLILKVKETCKYNWMEYKRELWSDISCKFRMKYQILSDDEEYIDEYGHVRYFHDIIADAIYHVSTYPFFENYGYDYFEDSK